MTDPLCAKCGERAESHWRIRLEHDSRGTSEATDYRLCRGCWEALGARHGGAQS
ncbi:hypothetical protein [Halococcus hamelinensis]|uniref:hypothetical protein n=1 Tax=Halococcus hamelinensis TaxID=332168 RepID=UPI000A82A288|nr:hypothetical protein [Halococcus hamelinensis]